MTIKEFFSFKQNKFFWINLIAMVIVVALLLFGVELAPTASLGVMAEGEAVLKGLQSFHSLPCFNTYLRQSYYVDVFNKGATESLTASGIALN